MSLLDAHAALHKWFDDAVYGVLERLVALDVHGARARFDHFVDVLEEHMAFENERVLPLYAPLAPSDGPGRLDHIEGDHVILLRHIHAIRAFFDEQPTTLREVLEKLPAVYRLLGTLEHHTAREQNNVYARISAGDDVEAALKALVERASAA